MSGARPAFGRPLPGDSLVHRCDPCVKLVVVLVVTLVLTAIVDPVTPGLLYVLAWPAAVWAGRIPVRTLARAHVPFVAFASSLLLVNATTRSGQVVGQVLGIGITSEGLAIGAGLAMRTLLVGVLSVTFVLTTDGARLMTSLHQHVRLSGRVAFAVLAGYRLLEQLPQMWLEIRQAQAMRDRTRRGRGPSAGPRALSRAAFTLLVTAVRRGERMAIALSTRGLGAGPRTIARPSNLRVADGVFTVVVLGVVALVLWATAHWGVQRGLSDLGVFG